MSIGSLVTGVPEISSISEVYVEVFLCLTLNGFFHETGLFSVLQLNAL